MNKDNEETKRLILTCLEGQASDAQVTLLNTRLRSDAAARDLYLELADLHSCLAVDESLWVDGVPARQALDVPARQTATFNWLNWRPLAAAASGLVLGMLCTSVVFAYTLPKAPAGTTAAASRYLPLADGDFESGAQIPAKGIPAHAGAWSGDFSHVVAAENGITPRQGSHMLRILRADHELSAKEAQSYVGSVAQVVDLRPLRAEFAGGEQLVEVSAQFNAIAVSHGPLFEFNVKTATFRGDTAHAPGIWEDQEASVSRSHRTVVADSNAATWQRVAVPLAVPADVDFLILETAVVFKGPQQAGSVAEFPGHYVDQVEIRVISSAISGPVAENSN